MGISHPDKDIEIGIVSDFKVVSNNGIKFTVLELYEHIKLLGDDVPTGSLISVTTTDSNNSFLMSGSIVASGVHFEDNITLGKEETNPDFSWLLDSDSEPEYE